MASRVDLLARSYVRHVGLPWDRGLAPAQRVWFAVYPKEDERRLRYKLEAFQVATVAAQKEWLLVDLTNSFARWIHSERYRDEYFRNPKMMSPKLPRFLDAAAEEIVGAAGGGQADEDTVVAVLGVASLFGFAQVSDLVPKVVPKISGRLLIFFPGTREGNVYRLLDAREGWNYLATPIDAFEEGSGT